MGRSNNKKKNAPISKNNAKINTTTEKKEGGSDGVGCLKLGTSWKALLYLVFAAVAIVYAYFYESEDAITTHMVDHFANGVDGWFDKDVETSLVTRDNLLADLQPILSPEKTTSYYVILGEKGVGKSTAVRQVLQQLEHPRGAIYMKANPTDRHGFLEDLATTTNYRKAVFFFESLRLFFSGMSGTDPILLNQLFNKLEVVGRAYKAKYGRPPVLVLDGADLLYKRDPMFLADLQALAKAGADDGYLRLVFVMSETSAFAILQSNSDASRSKTFVVGEIEDNEAVKFLMDKGINEKDAKDAVARITGGRFVLLNDYVINRQEGMTNDEILSEHKVATKRTLGILNFDVNHKLFEDVSTGSLEEDDARRLVGSTNLTALTHENILTINVKNGLVTFNSRHVQTFFADFANGSGGDDTSGGGVASDGCEA